MARRGTRGHEPREGGELAYGQTSFLADELFGEASLAVSWGLTHTHTHRDKRGVVTDLPRDVPSSRKFGGVSGKRDRCLNPLCQCSIRLLDSDRPFL